MQSSLGGGASKRSRGALSPRRGRYNDVDDVIDEDEARGSKRFLSEVRKTDSSIETVSLSKSRRQTTTKKLSQCSKRLPPHKKNQQNRTSPRAS